MFPGIGKTAKLRRIAGLPVDEGEASSIKPLSHDSTTFINNDDSPKTTCDNTEITQCGDSDDTCLCKQMEDLNTKDKGDNNDKTQDKGSTKKTLDW